MSGAAAAARAPFIDRLIIWADTLARRVAWLAMLSVGVAILVTVADVSTRRTVGWTVPGLVDLTQLLMMTFIFLSIPYCFMQDSNVTVDFVTDRLPPRLLAAVKAMAALLGLAFMAGITWYSLDRALQQVENGDASQTIGIPFGWYWGPLLLGTALASFAALLQTLRHLREMVRGAPVDRAQP